MTVATTMTSEHADSQLNSVNATPKSPNCWWLLAARLGRWKADRRRSDAKPTAVGSPPSPVGGEGAAVATVLHERRGLGPALGRSEPAEAELEEPGRIPHRSDQPTPESPGADEDRSLGRCETSANRRRGWAATAAAAAESAPEKRAGPGP